MNESGNHLNNMEDVRVCLEHLMTIGWVESFDLGTSTGTFRIDWTDTGRAKAGFLVQIDDEVGAGEHAWTTLLAVCRTLCLDDIDHGLN